MRFTNLKTNHYTNPLGFDLNPLTLSWIKENVHSEKVDVCIEIAMDQDFSDVVFSEWILSGHFDPSLDYQPAIELKPCTRYYWKLTGVGENQETCESETAWFETAKAPDTWQAKWIEPDEVYEDAHPIMKKQFQLKKEVKSARLYICGLGLYEFEINGKMSADEFLLPGYHSYDHWLQYQTFDITNLLKKDGNAIGVILGSGWYKGRFGFDGGYENLYGNQYKLIAELHVIYNDDSRETVITDDSWLVTRGPILESNIYDGEVYDARKEIKNATYFVKKEIHANWSNVNVTKDPTDKLSPRMSLPITYQETLYPEVLHTPTGEIVLDFKQNMVGWIEFETSASENTILKYETGEWLENGNFYNKNLRTAKSAFTYISDGSKRVVRPHFTFYGFRYAKLTGFDEPIESYHFVGKALHSNLERTGYIETSNEKVNQLIQNVLWGQKGNFVDVPMDCPQRDERMGWTGDAQVFARTASYNMYTPAFYRKFMHDLRLEQKTLNGSVPFVVPTLKPDITEGGFMGDGAAAWSDAATIIPWVLYEQYGDKCLLEEQYDTMVDWVEFICREDQKSGDSRLWTTRFQFGDWLALDGKNPDVPIGGTDARFVASVYYYYSTKLLSQAAAVLRKREDQEKYKKRSEETKQAIQNEYITPNGKLAIDTQTAYILLLYFDLVPEINKDRVIKDFETKILADDVHLKTGFVGTAYLCEALSKSGLNELAYSMLLNEDYPSWLYAINLGATTIWERWNSVLPNGEISDTEMNSLNHYASGSILEWMYRCVLGIQADPKNGGYKHFYLKPQPSAQLGEVKGRYNSASGEIKSAWKILEDGSLSYAFSVPDQSSATVTLLDCPEEFLLSLKHHSEVREVRSVGHEITFQLLEGQYAFTYKPTKTYKEKLSIDSTYQLLISKTASRKIIFHYLPMLKGNEMVMQYLTNSLRSFSKIPILQNVVTQEVLQKIESELAHI